MAAAAFRYLSPRSVVTMSRLDNTIIPVHEDPPVEFTAESIAESIAEATLADVETAADSNQRTKNQFRPRVGKGGATSYQLRQYAEVTLGGGSLRKVVKLPEGEDENEWLAVNSGSRHRSFKRGRSADCSSGRLLQPDQPALRRHHRVLLPAVVPRDEGNRRVRALPIRRIAKGVLTTIGSSTSGRIARTTSGRPRCRHRPTSNSS